MQKSAILFLTLLPMYDNRNIESKMQYPLISEYVDAIRSAEDNLDKLRDLRPVFDSNGTPIMSSGNFAVVFKMKDVRTGRMYAVKCFTREQEGREEAYRQIADELEFVQSSYLAKVRYYDHELFVDTNSSDDSEFPVLLMDWVEGETLDRYVRRNINDTYALEMLAYNFSRLAMWLLPQPFAHGDLKPDNILVQADGSLTLVDYDGMYVPAMQGQKSRELGSPDFRHPLRIDADFNEHIDDFPAISILLSLRLIAAAPSLLDSYGAPDRLLFTESDYRDLSLCTLLKNVFPSHDVDINTLVSLFTIAVTHKNLANVSTRLLAIGKPKKPVEEEISTKVTNEDLKTAIIDEFGAKYSSDGKRLLRAPNVEKYKIKDSTKVICENAFSGCNFLQQITIPSSIANIGDCAFLQCNSLQQITILSGVTSIGDGAFWDCDFLQQIVIPVSVKKIGINPFVYCKCEIICESPGFKVVDNVLYNADMTTLIAFLSDKKKFTIPSSVTSIGARAFYGCDSLEQIIIPSSVISIGDSAFTGCYSLRQIVIPENVNKIVGNPFDGCKYEIICESSKFKVVDNVLYDAGKATLISFISDKKSFTIPSSVTSIGDKAFCGCSSLRQITIPLSVTIIGGNAFTNCWSLEQITIPSSVTSIGDSAFCGCSSLEQITIPSSVTSIGDSAFCGCSSLEQITIPSSVTSIGDSAFCGCSSLEQITIPSSVTSIGDSAFCGCSSLEQITIPSSVTSIGDSAFCGCSSLEQITIPSSVKSIGDSTFKDCSSLWQIIIPSSVKSIGDSAFEDCSSLEQITISSSVTIIRDSAFPFYWSLRRIYIPRGSKSRFAKMLPNDINKLIETDNIE